MKFILAIRMLTGNRVRLIVAVVVISSLFFLSTAQVGLLVGWCRTIPAIVAHADADVWVMAEHTVAFDYGTPIPSSRLWQVRSTPGVVWAEAMFVGERGSWMSPRM